MKKGRALAGGNLHEEDGAIEAEFDSSKIMNPETLVLDCKTNKVMKWKDTSNMLAHSRLLRTIAKLVRDAKKTKPKSKSFDSLMTSAIHTPFEVEPKCYEYDMPLS